MNTKLSHRQINRGAWMILVICLFIGGALYSAPVPVFAAPASQVTAADLAVTMAPVQTPIDLLETIGYTIQVTNVGVGSATEVMLTDVLPTGFAYTWTVSGPDGASCQIVLGELMCSFGELAVGAVKTVTVSSPTNTNMLEGKITSRTIENTATVTGGNEVAGPNNSATASVVVLIPHIVVLNMAESNFVAATNPISYNIEVSNWGEGTATNIVLEYVVTNGAALNWSISNLDMPDGVTGSCSINTIGTIVTLDCSFNQLTAPDSIFITLTSPTTVDHCGLDVASIGSVNSDIGAGDGGKGIYEHIHITCPLSVNNSADEGPIVSGDAVGFTIGVENPYPFPVNDVVLTDTLPAIPGSQWVFPPEQADKCSIADGVLTCNLGTLQPQVPFSMRISSATSAAACGTVTNTVAYTASNTASNSASASATILCPNIFTLQWAENMRVQVGEPINLHIETGNMGDAPARDLYVEYALQGISNLFWTVANVTLPEGVSGSCAVDTSGAYPKLQCNFNQLGVSQEVDIVLTATAIDTCGTLESSGFVTASNGGEYSAAAMNITVLCPPLQITKTADAGPFEAGDLIGFTIRVTNPSPTAASDVIVTDVLPTNSALNWVADLPNLDECSIANGVMTCSIGTLAPNTSHNIHILSPTTWDSCGTVENTASVSDSRGFVANASASLILDCPDLSVTNTPASPAVSSGDPIRFDITVTNNGAGHAWNVSLKDTLPLFPGVNWSVDGPNKDSCAVTGNMLNCNFGEIETFVTRTIYVTSPTNRYTCAEPPYITTITNTADVKAYNHPTSSTAGSVTVNCPNLTLTNTAASHAISAGDSVRFDMTVTNDGPGQAWDVSLSDTLPNFTGVSWSVDGPNRDSCVIIGGELTCNFGDLAASETRTIYITSPTIYYTCSAFPYTTTVTNTAAVGATNQSSSSAAASLDIQCPSFGISVWPVNYNIAAGDPVSLIVEFTNDGAGLARDVLVEVSVPTNAGLSWSIGESIPAAAAEHCVFGVDDYGTPELICNFDQVAVGEEITLTINSPTTYGSCGALYSEGYISAPDGGGAKSKRLQINVTCPDVSVTSTVDQAGYTRDYAWAVEKTVDSNYANTILKSVPFDYTVEVSQTGFTDSAWLVQGQITVTNPNQNLPITGATVTDAVDNGGTCAVEGGTGVTIPAGGFVTLNYNCAYAAQPEYSGNHTASVAWDQSSYPFPSPNSDPAPFEFAALSTNNQSIDVTDTFNGEEIQLNSAAILASDNPEALTTWSQTYTREAPAPTDVCADYTSVTEVPGTGQSSSQTVRVCLPSLVTDSAMCAFDMDAATPEKDFRILFTPDPTGPNSIYKLNASNPGQFYYNIFYANPTGSAVSPTVTLTLPYPFVTQGAVPLHAYDSVSVTSQNGLPCLSPGAEIANSKVPVFGMADWGSGATFGSTREIQVQLPEIPANGFAYVNLHLDYGLKDSSGYTRGLNDNAVSPTVTIPNPQAYTFTDNLGMTHAVSSINVFKKNPGIGGQAASGATMNPVSNVQLEIFDSSNKRLATVYTDEDGWYMWNYKYTGKAAVFTIMATAPGYNKTQSVTLKSNAFVVVNFLDLP